MKKTSFHLACDLNISPAKTPEHPELEHLSDLFEEYMSGTLNSDDILEEKSRIRNMLRDNRTSKQYLDIIEQIMNSTYLYLQRMKCVEYDFPCLSSVH